MIDNVVRKALTRLVDELSGLEPDDYVTTDLVAAREYAQAVLDLTAEESK